jgi:hypothetical protein
MFTLPRIEFYITNVCNLNCTNCNRLNNFSFSGHYRWSDYESSYREWIKIIDFPEITIMGGEPFANPDLINWIRGIRKFWPASNIRIATNGTYLGRDKEIYRTIASEGKISLHVSGHNFKTFDDIINNIRQWIAPEYKETLLVNNNVWKKQYQNSKYLDWPDCDSVEKFETLPDQIKNILYENAVTPEQIFERKFIDSNGVVVHFTPIDFFYYTPIIHHFEDNSLSLRHSDPIQAINACYQKKCFTFKGDRLHKCGPSVLLSDFIKQFPVRMSEQDREIINSIEGAHWSWSESRLQDIIDNFLNEDPIDQCRFCATDHQTRILDPYPGKKIHIQKI